MIGETGWLRKRKTTNPPVVLEVYGVEGLTKKPINVYISHDRSLRGLSRKEITHRIGIEAAVMVVYDSKRRVSPLSTRWRVGHDYFLVLLFAATRKTSMLQTNQQGADAMLFF